MIDVTESVKTFINFFWFYMPGDAVIEHSIRGGDELDLVITCEHRGQMCTQPISVEKIQNCHSPGDLAAVHASEFRTKLLDMETRYYEDDGEGDE